MCEPVSSGECALALFSLGYQTSIEQDGQPLDQTWLLFTVKLHTPANSRWRRAASTLEKIEVGIVTTIMVSMNVTGNTIVQHSSENSHEHVDADQHYDAVEHWTQNMPSRCRGLNMRQGQSLRTYVENIKVHQWMAGHVRPGHREATFVRQHVRDTSHIAWSVERRSKGCAREDKRENNRRGQLYQAQSLSNPEQTQSTQNGGLHCPGEQRCHAIEQMSGHTTYPTRKV